MTEEEKKEQGGGGGGELVRKDDGGEGSSGLLPTSPDEVLHRMHVITDLMRRAMRRGEHYDKIPGCGDKLVLMKSGAEKLGVLFQVRPEFEITRNDYKGGHREYTVTCRLFSVASGRFVGEGVGSCSTLEGKYRFRAQNTGRPVPPEYWQSRDPAILGGSQYTARKSGGKWFVFEQVEHNNPSDYWNTVLKMAKKRAYVDAVITTCGASDIFTQDIEEDIARSEPTAPSPREEDPGKAPWDREDNTSSPDYGEPSDPPSPEEKKNGGFCVQICGKAIMDKDLQNHLVKAGFSWQSKFKGKGNGLTRGELTREEAQKMLDWLIELKEKTTENCYIYARSPDGTIDEL